MSVLQKNTFQWYGHVLQKEDNDWVKKYMSTKCRVSDTVINDWPPSVVNAPMPLRLTRHLPLTPTHPLLALSGHQRQFLASTVDNSAGAAE